MIAYIKGKILQKGAGSVVLVVQNVGYRIFVPAPALDGIHAGDDREFYTHEHVREDARDLYGFETTAEFGLFLKLIKVSGVGPKMALNIMSLGAGKVGDAITRGDVSVLSSISGVGTKTAQKIILDLKGTLAESAPVSSGDMDLLDALKSLGYSGREAQDALSKIAPAEKTEDRLREALKLLGKKR